MASSCAETLVNEMDAAAARFEFPGWQCGDQRAVFGAMRASGFDIGDGTALVFEDFEYSLDERVLQSLAFCVATVPVSNWMAVGDGAYVDVSPFASGDAPNDVDSIEVTSRDRSFSVELDPGTLDSTEVLASVERPPTPEAVLASTRQQVPADWLFSEPGYLIDSFGLGPDATRVFVTDAWEHPSFEALYAEDRSPGSFPDLVALAEAACGGVASPDLPGDPNTSLVDQCD